MKRLLSLVMLLSASAAFAAWQPIGVLRLADKDALSLQVGKVAGFFGNPLVSMTIAAKVSQYETPFAKFFGEPRKDAPIVFALYLDAEEETPALRKDISDIEYAVIYPVTIDVKGLKRLHKGCVETNGFIRVPEMVDFGDGVDDVEDYAEGEVEYNYVKFSADGKWAAMSDKPEQVELAMKEVKNADKPMMGEAAELVLNNLALKAFCPAAGGEERSGCKSCFASRQEAFVKDVSSIRMMVKADDAGLEFNVAAAGRDGSEIEKGTARSLKGEAFAYAPANAFFATACAPGFRRGASAEDSLRVIVNAAKAFGLDDTALILKHGKKSFDVEIDGVKLAACLNSPASNFYNRAGAQFKTFEDARMHFATNLTAYADSVNVKSEYNSFAFTGAKLVATPAQRFAATMPELAGKPLVAASVLDLTSLLVALEPVVVGVMPKPMQVAAKAMFFAVRGNADDKGAAMAIWGDGKVLCGKMRIAPSQFKTISTIGTIFVAKAMISLNGAKDADDDED